MIIIGEYYTKGLSGNQYPLKSFPIPYEHPIPSEWEGIYMFAKHGGDFILVGNGNIKSETDRLIKEGIVMEREAINIFIHVEHDPTQIKIKEIDIIKGNPECYGENGMNVIPS